MPAGCVFKLKASGLLLCAIGLWLQFGTPQPVEYEPSLLKFDFFFVY